MIIKDFSLSFGNKELLKDVNVNVQKGQLIGLIGDNGSGKSSLIKCITGETSHYSGSITLNGVELRKKDRLSLSKELAVVLSGRISAPGLMVKELLEIGRYPNLSWNLKLSDIDLEIIDEVCKSFNLGEFLTRQIDTLSDGEFQRVSIARAIVQAPEFLVMDEPSSFLDIKRKRELFKYLRQKSEEDMSIILASHDLQEVLEYCTDIWIIDSGKLVEFKRQDPLLKEHLDRIFAIKD